jgi:hypothetical protein
MGLRDPLVQFDADPDYTVRMEPADIVGALRAIAGVGG